MIGAVAPACIAGGMRRSHRLAALVSVAAALLPGEAFAHASDRGHVLLLPTGHYIAGGAAAVAASFLVLAFVPADRLSWLRGRLAVGHVDDRWRLAGSSLGFILLAVLVAAGWTGSRDPLSNPLPLTVWTLLWVGVTLSHGLLGNVWAVINPWYAPWRLAVALRLAPADGWLRLPAGIRSWPALLGFLAFAWFELVYPAPDDPAVLATVVAFYFGATFFAKLAFGFGTWQRAGEFLGLFYSLIGRFGVLAAGPLGNGRRKLELCWPGARLAAGAPLSTSETLFLLTALASVSFDSFSRTFAWLGMNGINPLELPGRTALLGFNTAGLLAAAAALSTVFYMTVWAGLRLARSRATLAGTAGYLVWSIVPIALAYHLAHYLVLLLVNEQYALVAWSDPFDLGWNLFGTAHRPVAAAIAGGAAGVWVVWNLQAGAIIVGHVVAVLLGHMLSDQLIGSNRRAIVSQLPLTLLMIGYTVLGLWLLSTPSAG